MDLHSAIAEFEQRDWRTGVDGTLRFALIGLGWWTVDQAIPAIRDSELCETTVVSSTAEKAERVADEASTIERAITYDEFHEGAAADAYDAVYICTPNALHLPYARTAADLGKAVLCEKPMEATVERAEELVDACADVPLMVAYRLHTQPAARRARELLREGFVGDPVHVYGANSQRLLDVFGGDGGWRVDPDLTGYGTSVMDLGIYPVNTARFLLGADPVAVQATADSHHEAFAEVPDERAAFTMTFDDGTLAACTTSQHAHGDTELKITGTEGQIDLAPAFHMESSLTVSRGAATAELSVEGVDEMEEEFDYFADRVLSGDPVEADGEHGLVDMRVMAAIYESARTGDTVTVDGG